MSKATAVAARFDAAYGGRYQRVSEWFSGEVEGRVEIVDLDETLPAFTRDLLDMTTA